MKILISERGNAHVVGNVDLPPMTLSDIVLKLRVEAISRVRVDTGLVELYLHYTPTVTANLSVHFHAATSGTRKAAIGAVRKNESAGLFAEESLAAGSPMNSIEVHPVVAVHDGDDAYSVSNLGVGEAAINNLLKQHFLTGKKVSPEEQIKGLKVRHNSANHETFVTALHKRFKRHFTLCQQANSASTYLQPADKATDPVRSEALEKAIGEGALPPEAVLDPMALGKVREQIDDNVRGLSTLLTNFATIELTIDARHLLSLSQEGMHPALKAIDSSWLARTLTQACSKLKLF